MIDNNLAEHIVYQPVHLDETNALVSMYSRGQK